MRVALVSLLLVACAGGEDSHPVDSDDSGLAGDPFADALVAFAPGENATFGAAALPDVVLGPPEGGGDDAGSTHVVSLGRLGEIVLEFTDLGLVDGDGPDLIVFENRFSTWVETGRVAVSDDGETFVEWPCDPIDDEGGYPGCAGVASVYAASYNDLDPTDPDVAGGDAFDLADIGVTEARYVRIRDSGVNPDDAPASGFDLDALAVVNGAPID